MAWPHEHTHTHDQSSLCPKARCQDICMFTQHTAAVLRCTHACPNMNCAQHSLNKPRLDPRLQSAKQTWQQYLDARTVLACTNDIQRSMQHMKQAINSQKAMQHTKMHISNNMFFFQTSLSIAVPLPLILLWMPRRLWWLLCFQCFWHRRRCWQMSRPRVCHSRRHETSWHQLLFDRHLRRDLGTS